MQLSDYLTQNRLTGSAFAKMSGLSRSAVSRILNGERVGNWDTIEKIEAATDGKVTVDDLRPKKSA